MFFVQPANPTEANHGNLRIDKAMHLLPVSPA